MAVSNCKNIKPIVESVGKVQIKNVGTMDRVNSRISRYGYEGAPCLDQIKFE